MDTKTGLIYFVHDDTKNVFTKKIIPTLLHIPVSENIKVILIHNQRQKLPNGSKDAVTYISVVKEVVTRADGITAFNTLKEDISLWQDAFTFAFDYLQKEKYFNKLGLITLSHSNGFVITGSVQDLKTFVASDIPDSPSFKTIIDEFSEGELFVNAKSVLGIDMSNNSSELPAFVPVYTRDEDHDFCKTYEGFFFAQLSDFLRTELDKLGNKKLDFFISNNCNFQLYDNAFLFSSVAKFTMGAQSFSNISFFHFPTIIDAIMTTYDQDAETTCKLIFRLCSERFRRHVTKTFYHYFLVDCEQFLLRLNPSFKMIMEILVRAIQSRRINQKLVKSIKPLLRTSNDGEIPYFDALQFFRKAKRIVALPEFNVAFNKFKAELGKTSIIVSKYVLDHRKLCGFSLYLPLNREEFDRLKGNQCNYFERIVNNRLTDFAIETQFDEFLKALYENLPAVPRQTIPALPLAISVSEGVMKEADEEVGGVPKGY